MPRILFIVGSLRKGSFNLQLARKAEKVLEGRAEVGYLDFSDLPYMNQDGEYPAPESVARVRASVQNADAIWFFTPEYNSSYPGLLKNLLDWLSRPLAPGDYASPTAISGRPAAISGVAGKSACANSMEKLTALLKMMRLELLESPMLGIALPPESWQTGALIMTPDQETALAQEAAALLGMVGE